MMQKKVKPITILIADDDADDRLLTKEALEESYLLNDLRFVVDGEDLMSYLHRKGKYSDPATSPHHAPGLSRTLPKHRRGGTFHSDRNDSPG